MTALRKSGSCVAYTWSGALTDPRDAEFCAALANRRFRTIENAASEETSFGWVTPEDPSGGSFSFEDLDAGAGTWLRLRFDVKKLPAEQVRMHLAAAKRAKGKALSARERREAKEALAEALLPRILPTTRNVDALLFVDQRLLLVFGTSKSVLDAVGESLVGSFGSIAPLRLTAGARALEACGEAVIGKLQPQRFCGGLRQLTIEATADYLGSEFLTWLWWRCETAGGEFALPGNRMVGVAFDAMLQFAAPDDETETTLRHGIPSRSSEARAALAQGRLLAKAQVLIAEGARQWTAAIAGASMVVNGKLPDDAEECEGDTDRTADRAANWLALHEIVQGLYRSFLDVRVSAQWSEAAQGMAAWMRGQP